MVMKVKGDTSKGVTEFPGDNKKNNKKMILTNFELQCFESL